MSTSVYMEDFENFELISSSSFCNRTDHKESICRYCGNNNSVVSFKQQTHLLPELFGENSVFTFDECDSCNSLFSDYESHLAIFVRPYLTLLGIKGKQKVPTFQSRTIGNIESTRLTLKHNSDTHKEILIQNLTDYSIDPASKRFSLNFRKSAYMPEKVYKSLLKIGLSLLPKELDHLNKQSFEWLTNRKDNLIFIRIAFATTLKTKKFSKSSADLYKTKNVFNDPSKGSQYVLIVCFANQVFQIFLPFIEDIQLNCPNKLIERIGIFPGIAYDPIQKGKKFKVRYYDLGINTLIEQNEKIEFKYKYGEIKF